MCVFSVCLFTFQYYISLSLYIVYIFCGFVVLLESSIIIIIIMDNSNLTHHPSAAPPFHHHHHHHPKRSHTYNSFVVVVVVIIRNDWIYNIYNMATTNTSLCGFYMPTHTLLAFHHHCIYRIIYRSTDCDLSLPLYIYIYNFFSIYSQSVYKQVYHCILVYTRATDWYKKKCTVSIFS